MVDGYGAPVHNLYDNDNHSHLRIIADDLDVHEIYEEASPDSPRLAIREHRRSYREQDIATTLPKQPVFINDDEGTPVLTANQAKPGVTRATIHAKPGLTATIKPVDDNLITLQYNGAESEDNTPRTTLTGDHSAALFTPSQLVTYLKDDHPVSDEGAAHTMGREEGVTDVYFAPAPTETPDFQVTNQAAYTFRRAMHHADIHLTSTTPDDNVVFDTNIDYELR